LRSDELLETLERAETVLPSGARFHYSNLAYALLGIVVERVSGPEPGEALRIERGADEWGPLGVNCDFEGKRPFRQVGINLNRLLSGQQMGVYHRERHDEGFLVIAGECLLPSLVLAQG
jgi:CubicO group peptidase (beta-lactamase class C family)